MIQILKIEFIGVHFVFSHAQKKIRYAVHPKP